MENKQEDGKRNSKRKSSILGRTAVALVAGSIGVVAGATAFEDDRPPNGTVTVDQAQQASNIAYNIGVQNGMDGLEPSNGPFIPDPNIDVVDPVAAALVDSSRIGNVPESISDIADSEFSEAGKQIFSRLD